MNYLIFLVGEIELDLQDNTLLRIILFPLSMGFAERGLLTGLWAVRIGPSFWAGVKGLSASMGALLLWVWRVGLRAHFSNPINFPPTLVYDVHGQGL